MCAPDGIALQNIEYDYGVRLDYISLEQHKVAFKDHFTVMKETSKLNRRVGGVF